MPPSSFTEALEPHYADALRYCRALCARWSPADAEDVLQDALLKAIRHFGSLREPERFRSWLFSIITRSHYTAARRHFWNRFVPIDSPDAIPRIPPVFAAAEGTDDRLLILQALRILSESERATLLLFEVGGFSVAEIAEMRGDRSVSAVKSRLSRARSRLRARLEQLGHAPPVRSLRDHSFSL